MPPAVLGSPTACTQVAVVPPPRPGVPPEFNEFLPKDGDEYRRWRVNQEAGASGALEALTLGASGTPTAAEAATVAEQLKQLPGGKKKKKSKPEVVLERNTRNKKKCITTIIGLEGFGIKLPEAAKLFGKKFASGASITKNAEGREQIDCQVGPKTLGAVWWLGRGWCNTPPTQGDFLDQAAELILKQFSEVQRSDVYVIEAKKKVHYFDEGLGVL